MKKTIMNIRTMAALLIASAAFTACSNEDGAVIGEQPAAMQTPQVYTLTLQAANATGAQHRALALDGTKLVAKWAAGDELTVRNINSSYELLGGTLTASNVSADGQTCTFSGTLTGTIAVGNQLDLFYHATSGTQDGTLESAAANDQADAIVTVASVEAGNITISESEASFNTTTAVLKLTLKDGSANALNATSLKMTVDGTDFFTASPTAATYTANGNGVLYFAVPPKDNAAAIIAQEKSGGSLTPALIETWKTNLNTYDVTFTATVGSDTYTATKTGYKLAGGKYYATELTMAKAVPEGAINGQFSVSSTKKVFFSKGNLQATYNESWTWAFATNQWDYIGNAAGNTSINGGGTISGTGTVDLFGWVGEACAWTGAAQYGISNVTAAAQYGNVAGEALKSDWGTLAISNGGNTANFGWHSLASGEWEYLFKTRTTPSSVRYAHAEVNSVPGLVLLPDDWSTAYYSLNNVNDAYSTAYTDNVISSSDWTSKLEAHGAVFLPAGGYRNGASVSNAGVKGNYWSSTSDTDTKEYALSFFFGSGRFVGSTSGAARNRGYSVRLVYDAN